MHAMHFLMGRTGDALVKLYRAVDSYIAQGNCVIYSVELAHSAQIIRKMVQSMELPEAEDYVQSGMLTVIDGQVLSDQKMRLTETQLADLLFETAAKARRKSGAKGTVVMCNTEALVSKGNYAKQIRLEQAINQKFQTSTGEVKVICCYYSPALENISLKDLVPLVNAHGSIVDKDWKRKDWYPADIMKVIAKGIESSSDKLTADLLLKTFKLVYKIDERSIMSNPALFEDTLRKIIGNGAADAILTSIVKEYQSRITQD